MQMELQKTLKQQKNLAALGLAVSKINHDMRNILASAQLMSDRLVDVDDPDGEALCAEAAAHHRPRRRLYDRGAVLWPGKRSGAAPAPHPAF